MAPLEAREGSGGEGRVHYGGLFPLAHDVEFPVFYEDLYHVPVAALGQNCFRCAVIGRG